MLDLIGRVKWTNCRTLTSAKYVIMRAFLPGGLRNRRLPATHTRNLISARFVCVRAESANGFYISKPT